MFTNKDLKALRTRDGDDAFTAKHGPKEAWIIAEGLRGVSGHEAEKEYKRLRAEALAERAEDMNEVAKRYIT